MYMFLWFLQFLSFWPQILTISQNQELKKKVKISNI